MQRLGGRKLLVVMEEFMQNHGLRIGRDAFFTLLRENGLLIRKKCRRPKTTDSRHWLKRYPWLAEGYTPTEPHQLWVSDITYIKAATSFVYLSLITDAYSRKIVGVYLSEDLCAKGCINALKMALKTLPEKHRLIHHSDRGVQYCSQAYVNLLYKSHIPISMTQTGDPLDNALAERVNGILKDELMEEKYPSYSCAQRQVATAISVYNHYRPHSSVDMLTPAEAHLRTGELQRRWKNYYKSKKEKEVEMT